MKKYIRLVTAVALIVCLSVTGAKATSVNDRPSDNSECEEIKTTIEKYYEKSYDSWLDLEPADLSKYLDMDSIQMCNKVTVLDRTIDRWRYEIQKGYYKGQRERNKMSFNYSKIDISGNNASVTAIISLEEKTNAAYPFFIQSGKNIFQMTKKDGKWLISGHDYDDVTLYEESKTKKITYDIVALHKLIDAEYSFIPQETEDTDVLDHSILRYNPYDEYPYSSSRAVAYANNFYSQSNGYFYSAPADCTNFVSQCISYGFGATSSYSSSSSYRMVSGTTYTSGWYTGSQSWEQVPAHWNYMLSSKTDMNGPRVREGSISELSAGDVMQIDFNNDGTYDHSTICVDASNRIFAQHTSNGLRYYSDYSGTKRFYKPIRFRVY